MLRRNDGPPWRRKDGSLVAHGETFDTTVREEQILENGGTVLQRVFPAVQVAGTPAAAVQAPVVTPPPTPPPAPVPPLDVPPADVTPTETVEAPVEAKVEWPVKLDPKSYLSRYPHGQHAALARQLLGLPAEEGDA